MKKYYVAGFLFSNDLSKVVLIRKNKPEWQQGLLNGCGGKIELYDESPTYAMIREFKEEAGIEVKNWVEFCKLTGKEFEVYFFKAVGDISKAISMEDEKIEIIDVTNLQNEKTINNLQWLIPLALDTDKVHGQVNYY